MSFKKMLVSGVAALTIMGGSAFAANNAAGASVALDGTGDYLVFPYYAAVASWKTNLRVINTNVEKAVVAKVVVREWRTSAEKLDFLIYLTPGDVWEGQLVNENGKVVLKTNDDSFILPDGTSAADVPQVVPLFDADTQAGEDNNFGYVEVVGLASIDAALIDPYWVPYTQLDKEMLRKHYMRHVHGRSVAHAMQEGWTGVDNNSLTAQEILFAKNQYGNLAMTLNATALEGFTGSRPNTYAQIGVDTSYTNVVVPDAGTTAADVIKSAKNALRKYEVYVPFYNNGSNGVAETALLMTMPMKKYEFQISRAPESCFTSDLPTSQIKSPLDWYISWGILARDMKETSTKPPFSGVKKRKCNTEICIWSDLSAYTKDFTDGYARLITCAEGIPTAMTAKNVEGTNVTNIYYPAYLGY